MSASAADKIASTLPFSVVILLSTDVEYVENPVVDDTVICELPLTMPDGIELISTYVICDEPETNVGNELIPLNVICEEPLTIPLPFVSYEDVAVF